jgi:thioredoxin-related protein
MAFYKRLSAQPTLPAGALQLSVVSVEPERQMREYLVRQGLDVPTVVPGLEVGFTMAATPTLVLADKSGKVVASWEGLLDAEREQDVLSRVAELVGKQ